MRTYEEWITWLHDVSTTLDVEHFMRDEITHIMPEPVFMELFIKGQAATMLAADDITPAALTQMGGYDRLAFNAYMQTVVMAATIVGFRLGQESNQPT
jgi:hypothetical protein